MEALLAALHAHMTSRSSCLSRDNEGGGMGNCRSEGRGGKGGDSSGGAEPRTGNWGVRVPCRTVGTGSPGE